ncbi:MAG: ParA family protein [Planctomycetes bacterium]|nr:ParA family protein [Planctomycetota bacterium]
MKTIAIFNQKGGVGKTTIAFHLGWALTQAGRRVLLVDLDPQGNLSTLFEANACLAQHIFTKQPPDALQAHEIQRSSPSGPNRFWLVTADEQLQSVEATTNGLTGLTRLRKALRSREGEWDYAIIDCPPSLGGFSANAIVAADHLLVPCTLRQFSIHGLEHVRETIDATRDEGLNPDVQILGIVLNQYREDAKHKTAFERDISGDVTAKYRQLVVSKGIPSSIKIEEALYAKLPIWEYAKQVKDRTAAAAAMGYLAVMDELFQRLEGEKEGGSHGNAGETVLSDEAVRDAGNAAPTCGGATDSGIAAEGPRP